MSSEEEDNNPHYPSPQKGDKQNAKPQIEETTELDNDQEDDEDQNLQDNNEAIAKQRTGVVVTVGNPLLKDGGMMQKKFTDYEVSGQDKHGSFSVRRRYKEFNQLRAKLVENWPGFFIPPIPEKKSTGNTDPTFVKQRQHALNHFMERCGRMPHIFYSQEMQHFIRADNFTKVLATVKTLTPTAMYQRNKEHFAEYDKELNDKVQKSLKKYFETLDKTLKFFESFRNNAKTMQAIRPKFKSVKAHFMKYAVSDYKNKLKGTEAKAVVDAKCKEYQKAEKEDDLSEFLRNLKDLQLDLSSFSQIKGDLEEMKKSVDKIKKKQEEANKNLTKVRSMEANEVKDGMFKKVSKAEMITKLEKEIEEV